MDETAGINAAEVFVDFLWDGVAIPNATGLQFTTTLNTICLGKEINKASASMAGKYTTTESESAALTAVVYDAYSGATIFPAYGGGTEIKRFNWNVNLRALNTLLELLLIKIILLLFVPIPVDSHLRLIVDVLCCNMTLMILVIMMTQLILGQLIN